MVPAFFDEGHGYDVFGLHLKHVAAVLRATAPLYERYFRVMSEGVEHVPAEGPAILIANHAGILPLDAGLLYNDVLRRTGRIPRIVADRFVPRLPIVSTLFARVGVISGTPHNVAHVLRRGELLAIFPEGTTGPKKPFRDRYQLQAWRVGFAELAIRYRAPVVPVAIVGAEEAWPLAARIPIRLFGSPYLPVPMSPVPLPVRVRLVYGAPLHLDHGYVYADADAPDVVRAAAARAREALQHLLAAALAARTGVFR